MFRQEVCRRLRLSAGEPLAKSLGRLPRIVRSRERYPREEGLVAKALHECFGGIPKEFRRVQSSWLGLHGLAVPGERHHRHAELIVHAPQKHAAPLGKTPRRRSSAVVPLAGEEGPVAGPPKGLGPGIAAAELFVDMEERPAGEHHRAAGHADRRIPAAHAIRTAEDRAPRDEGIDRWRPQVGIAKGPNRVGPLVVGEDDEHARRPRPVGTNRPHQQDRHKCDAAEDQLEPSVSAHDQQFLSPGGNMQAQSPPRSFATR